MKSWSLSLFAALALLLISSQALAAPERVDVTGSFPDGATVSGYYVYDPAIPSFTQINVSVTGGALPDATYVRVDQRVSEGIWLVAQTAAGTGDGERALTLKTAIAGSPRPFYIYEAIAILTVCSPQPSAKAWVQASCT